MISWYGDLFAQKRIFRNFLNDTETSKKQNTNFHFQNNNYKNIGLSFCRKKILYSLWPKLKISVN